MSAQRPMCQVNPHADGLSITGWEPERMVPRHTPGRHRNVVRASVVVTCERHGWSGRVGVDGDYRPPGYEPWPG